MRIPTNSTFTKEISKQFKRIFHKDMSLGSLEEIKNLQENDLINPVDSYLEDQVTQIRKANGNKENVSNARAVRQEYTQGKGAIGKIVQIETEEKGVGF
jgi:translation elongation factor EF-Ts